VTVHRSSRAINEGDPAGIAPTDHQPSAAAHRVDRWSRRWLSTGQRAPAGSWFRSARMTSAEGVTHRLSSATAGYRRGDTRRRQCPQGGADGVSCVTASLASLTARPPGPQRAGGASVASCRVIGGLAHPPGWSRSVRRVLDSAPGSLPGSVAWHSSSAPATTSSSRPRR